MTWRTLRSTIQRNFIALRLPMPEISVTKMPADKQTNKVRQLTRLAYIPTCRSPLPPRLWPWPLTSQGHPKWSLWVQHRDCCRSWSFTSKSMTLIFDPSRSSKVKDDGANWKPVGRTCKCSTRTNLVSVTVFEIFGVKILTFHLLTLIGLTLQPKVTKMGDDVPPTLVYHTEKLQPDRANYVRNMLPKFFTFWPLGANPWAKVHQKGRRSGGLRDLPACKISSLYANPCPGYPLPKFLRTNKQKKTRTPVVRTGVYAHMPIAVTANVYNTGRHRASGGMFLTRSATVVHVCRAG